MLTMLRDCWPCYPSLLPQHCCFRHWQRETGTTDLCRDSRICLYCIEKLLTDSMQQLGGFAKAMASLGLVSSILLLYLTFILWFSSTQSHPARYWHRCCRNGKITKLCSRLLQDPWSIIDFKEEIGSWGKTRFTQRGHWMGEIFIPHK